MSTAVAPSGVKRNPMTIFVDDRPTQIERFVYKTSDVRTSNYLRVQYLDGRDDYFQISRSPEAAGTFEDFSRPPSVEGLLSR
jgi:hypothetical protein